MDGLEGDCESIVWDSGQTPPTQLTVIARGPTPFLSLTGI